MKKMIRYLFSFLAVLTLALHGALPSILAQSQPSPVGRWEGSVDLQSLKLGVIVNFSQNKDRAWEGTITIPSQRVADSALGNISVTGSEIAFAMPGVPGDPVYRGKLSADGKTISGELTQSGRTFPFRLERRTAAESAAGATYGPTPDKGKPGQGIEGFWQGTLDAGGVSLRLVLKMTKTVDGSFAAKVDSPDESIIDLRVDTIALKGGTLSFEMKRLKASYEGSLSQDGSEISGQWRQSGVSLPLTFKRLDPK